MRQPDERVPEVGPAITLGTGVVSLGVIHDLAAEGVPVIHVSTKPSDIALRSRLPVQKVVSAGEDEAVLDLLLERADEWRGACLIPTVDPLVALISRNRDRLTPSYRTAVQEWSKLEPVVDKSKLYETARAIGVPAPRVVAVSPGADIRDAVRRIGYPVIVKPSQTPEFFSVFKRKVLEADDEQQLVSILDTVLARGLDVMVSQIIPGDVTCLYCYRAYVDRTGRVAAEMCSQKVRTHPPEYGVGRVQRTVPMIPELRDSGRRLLEHLGFRGYASMEFKLDPRDGTFKLMEINPRPALCQRLFRAAGMNFAHLEYLDMYGMALPEVRYDPNVYVIHNTDELYYIRSYMRAGLKGIREFMAPYREKRRVYMIPSIKDPMPLLYQLRRVLGGALQRRAGRLGGARVGRGELT